MKKYFFRVHVEQVHSADSVIVPGLDNEAIQHTTQSEEVTRSHTSIEPVQSLSSRDLAQSQDLDEAEDNTTSRTYPNGNLVNPTLHDATQIIEQSAERSVLGEIQKPITSKLKFALQSLVLQGKKYELISS
jgi:hypothetical protein